MTENSRTLGFDSRSFETGQRASIRSVDFDPREEVAFWHCAPHRRLIAVRIDRYDVGQHRDGVGTLRRWERAGTAVPCSFPDPRIFPPVRANYFPVFQSGNSVGK